MFELCILPAMNIYISQFKHKAKFMAMAGAYKAIYSFRFLKVSKVGKYKTSLTPSRQLAEIRSIKNARVSEMTEL